MYQNATLHAELDGVKLTVEQLRALKEAGTDRPIALEGLGRLDFEDGTFRLTKGRLDVDEDGSTVVVRGGHDYDHGTGTVSVTDGSKSTRGAPDGLLVGSDGSVRPSSLFFSCARCVR